MNQQWEVIYYISASGDNPVKEFLDAVSPSVKAKTLRLLLNISNYGLSTVIPHIKKLSGTPLWEIRILGQDNVRILYVTKVGRKMLLLHAFYKKKQKTPQKELKTALARLKDYDGS